MSNAVRNLLIGLAAFLVLLVVLVPVLFLFLSGQPPNNAYGAWLPAVRDVAIIYSSLFMCVGAILFIFMTAGVAETNRAPFDFPEAEQELVAGYHTEYSSMSFALFFLAEYINMVTVSAVATDLYLGGWHWPLPLAWGWPVGVLNWLMKVAFLLFFYIWMRWTLPRYRYDQLMSFGWKWLLPASVVNLLLTAAGVIYFS